MQGVIRRTVVLVLGAMFASTASADPVNLIVNGDFSLGTVDFSTDYVDSPGAGSGWLPGVYSVEWQEAQWNPLFVTAGDHTTGSGNMLVVNGMDTSVPNTVWQTTVSGLTTNTDYYFEGFLMNLCCSTLTRPGPDLSFYANDMLVGVGSTDTPGVWTDVSTTWNSGSADMVTLALRNNSAVYSGNDFAVDDLYLGLGSEAAPEPASMVLLGSGLLVSVARLRRARRAVRAL